MQNSITNNFNATGLPGEFSRSIGKDARGAILNSTNEAFNLAGTAVLDTAGNDFEVGVASTGNFAGLIVNMKSLVRQSLDAQAFVSNETQIEIATAGYLYVTLAAAAANGDYVYYSDTDGTLATAPPATTAPVGHSRLPGGVVKGLNVTAAGVGEIRFDISGSTFSTP